MNIRIQRNGTWQKVSKQQLLELVSAGVVRPDTAVLYNDQQIVAARLNGLVFPSQVAVPPPLPTAPQAARAVPVPHSAPQATRTTNRSAIIAGIAIVVVAGIVCLTHGCGSDNPLSDNPSTVVRKFDAALKNGDKKTQGQLTTPEAIKLLSLFGETAESKSKLNGKIKSCQHTITGDTAVVHITYENGANEDFLLAKIDGKWKIGSDLDKRKDAELYISQVVSALDHYELAIGAFPTSKQGLHALFQCPSDLAAPKNWDGPYLKKTPTNLDPWGSPYQYVSPGQRAIGFDIWSFGPDCTDGTDDDIGNW